ncbi:hypothetical protein Tco_1142147 [Tanacetum coccineum]
MPCPVEGGGPEDTNDREETPPPLTKEQIEGHVSALKSLIKNHNQRNKGDPIRLDFELEDTKVQDHGIAKGNEVVDEDLRKPFKEARKTPLTSRIMEFAGPEYKMPTNIKLYGGTIDQEDHLSRFASAVNSGEWPMPVWCRMFQQTLDRNGRNPSQSIPYVQQKGQPVVSKTHPGDLRRNDYRNNYRGRDAYPVSRTRDYKAPYPPSRGEYNNRVALVLTLDSLTKHPKEILATKTQLRLPASRLMLNPLRSGNTDRYYDYHQEKGHYTNDCIHLRKQLEMALESGKLNHLVKDVRQRGRGLPRQRCSPTGQNNQCDQCKLSQRQETKGTGGNGGMYEHPYNRVPSATSEGNVLMSP